MIEISVVRVEEPLGTYWTYELTSKYDLTGDYVMTGGYYELAEDAAIAAIRERQHAINGYWADQQLKLF